MTGGVSVIIPAYNAAPLIGEAVESALRQTLPPAEILVIDDGSTDDTASVVERFGPRVTLLRKSNGGPASARNLGAAHARGEWLAMLDADDSWMAEKLERQLRLDTSERIGVIHCLANTSYPDVPPELTFEDLWDGRNWIVNSTALVRRAVFDAVGGFNEDRTLVEDYHLWLRIAHEGWRIVMCSEILCTYTRGGGLTSNRAWFLRASLRNADMIGRKFGLPPNVVRRKRAEILDEFARTALHARDLRDAARLMAQGMAEKASGKRVPTLPMGQLISGALRVAGRRLPAGRTPGAERPRVKANTSIFGSGDCRYARFAVSRPMLLTIVDTEEEFDWSAVPSTSISVKSIKQQHLAQRIFERHKVVPTYAVDYAVASQPEGVRPLLPYLSDGKCEIGTQLHPWINPPNEEELSEFNTYPGNLPKALEFGKLRLLTEKIKESFATVPILYRSGRYGAGPNTAAALEELGYTVDCSVLPMHDLRWKYGPDYRLSPTQPYWFGTGGKLLELPVTVGATGLLSGIPQRMQGLAFTRLAERWHVSGAVARLKLLERVRLTPEGILIEEAKQLTRSMLRRGHKVFVLSYHSPSLEPGNTPYVRSAADLERFLAWIEAYLEFFMGEVGGVPSTPGAVYAMAEQARQASPR